MQQRGDGGSVMDPPAAASRGDAFRIQHRLRRHPIHPCCHFLPAKIDEPVVERVPIRRAHPRLRPTTRAAGKVGWSLIPADQGDQLAWPQPLFSGKSADRDALPSCPTGFPDLR